VIELVVEVTHVGVPGAVGLTQANVSSIVE
jgi:hypothetical protein